MSHSNNDRFWENLYERVAALNGVTPGSVDDFERYVAENDFEGAESFVETLEAIHADDL